MARREGSGFAIYCLFIQVIIVLSLTVVVMWLSTRPQIPKFTITSIYIPQTGNQNLSKFQQNESHRNSSLVFVLEITNPNYGKTICYADISMKAHDGGLLVGNKSVGPVFCQGQKKTVTEEVVMNVDQKFRLANAGGGDGLRVSVDATFIYHISNWKTKIRHMGFEGFVIYRGDHHQLVS